MPSLPHNNTEHFTPFYQKLYPPHLQYWTFHTFLPETVPISLTILNTSHLSTRNCTHLIDKTEHFTPFYQKLYAPHWQNWTLRTFLSETVPASLTILNTSPIFTRNCTHLIDNTEDFISIMPAEWTPLDSDVCFTAVVEPMFTRVQSLSFLSRRDGVREIYSVGDFTVVRRFHTCNANGKWYRSTL